MEVRSRVFIVKRSEPQAEVSNDGVKEAGRQMELMGEILNDENLRRAINAVKRDKTFLSQPIYPLPQQPVQVVYPVLLHAWHPRLSSYEFRPPPGRYRILISVPRDVLLFTAILYDWFSLSLIPVFRIDDLLVPEYCIF